MAREIQIDVDHGVQTFRPQNAVAQIQRFIADENGPTAVEYAIMLALIILVCASTIGTIGMKASMGALWDTVEALD